MRNRVRNSIILSIALCFITTACNRSFSKSVALGKDCYAIPSEHLLNYSFKYEIPYGLEADRSVASIHAIFPSSYVESKVPEYSPTYQGYRGLVDAELTVIISSLSPDNIEYIHSGKHYEHLWIGTGSYSEEGLGQRVLWDEEVKLYRIYHKEVSGSWVFTRLDPQDVNIIPPTSAVVGGCSDERHLGLQHYNCLHKELRDTILIDYSLPEENFLFFQEIDDFVYAELESWKVGSIAEIGCLSDNI